MKLRILSLIALAVIFQTLSAFGEDQPGGCKCEMMKPKAGASVAEAPLSESALQQAELEKLIAEMNGNLGPKRIEAMAAIITRLVEQSKMKVSPQPVKSVGGDAPKAEGHQH
jgi:hypothetical protein